MSKAKCPACGALSIRSGATKCPSCQAWVQPPKFTKRRLRLSPVALFCFASGLCIVGMVAGVVATVTAQSRRAAPRVVVAPSAVDIATTASAVGEPVPASSASAADSALPAPSAVASAGVHVDVADPPAAEGKFVKTQQVRLDAPPVDVQFSSDESFVYVLGEDGTVRAHETSTGAEKHRVKLPGRGKSLRWLPGSRLAVLGLPVQLVIIDVAAWAAGRTEADFVKQVGVRNALDAVGVGDPATVVVVADQGGRVLRLSKDLGTIDAEFVSVPPVQALATLRVGDDERLAMLIPGRPPADSGAVIICDPTIDPFGGSRAVWSAVVDPRGSLQKSSDRILLFDPPTATVVDFSLGGERRVAPSGPSPIAAFRWAGDRAVVIGAAGDATVVSFGRRAVQATVSLGAVPSAAVATPDRRAVVVALGGGLRGRGATTVVLSGEPLAVESTVETGEGSHVVAMAPKGGIVAVGATGARVLTLLARK